MGSWIERGILIAFGAAWVAFSVVAIVAFGIRDKAHARVWVSHDWAGAVWLLLARGLPGAFFLLAGSTADRNFLWAAGAALLAGLVLELALRRYFGTGSSL